MAVTYRRSSAEDTPSFPTLGGSTRSSSWDVPVTLSLPTGRVFHQLRLSYNRNRSESRNIFADVRDVAGEAGIEGASANPFDWGVPNLSFTTLSGLRDRNPSLRLDQRFTVSDTATRAWGKHTFRFGGGFRTQSLDSETDSNARGSFVFTGLYTSATSGVTGPSPIPGTGSDFADFLLGQAQQASVQYGPGRVTFHGNAWNLFLQDDWRLRTNLTLNLGLRYEYVSPLEEENGHPVNLDVSPGFTAAVPVLAGQTGAFSGAFPGSLVNADRNNVAPRLGVAWKAKPNLTMRTGFGINYTLGAYGGIAQQLAGQPPFAVSNTLLGTNTSPLLLGDALTQPGPATSNSFGIDPHYQLPAVALWNLDVQRRFGRDLIVGLGYSGARGYDLDLQRAPNRGPDGLRIPDVAPFLWESSGARSILHSATLRVRKRQTHGFGGGFTYTFGRSIDNASSIGGGAVVVAQNDQDLAAERGLSSFDRRHNVAADWTLELPVGPARKWLREGALGSVIGGWVWSGNATLQSGTPFTARVVGNFGDVARGVNGTLRANVTGADVSAADPGGGHVVQHRGVCGSSAGHVRGRGPQHDHRPEHVPREHEPHQEHLPRTASHPLHSRPGEQRLQHAAPPGYRHGGELAHLRPGGAGRLDADRADPDEVPLLNRRCTRATSALLAAALAVPAGPATAQGPTFQAAVALVRVSVLVRDKSGSLVRGLKREDWLSPVRK